MVEANVDYIECGYLKSADYDADKTVFSEINQLKDFQVLNFSNTRFTLMINYGEYDIRKIPQCCDKNILLRVAFKKNNWESAIKYCKQLYEKGYGVFVNPMHTNCYENDELLMLLKEVNSFSPFAFTIVDSVGEMSQEDLLRIYMLADSNLDKNIAIGFHSHNNLGLSLSKAKSLVKLNQNRELIIDSTLLGIGRGAGNLSTEELMDYLNNESGAKYNKSGSLDLFENPFKSVLAKIK